jgi:hypothetical protein
MTTRSAVLDAGAITLSVLCLLHCLALPVLAVAMPVLGALAEAEWVHRLLVLIAMPVPLAAIAADKGRRGRVEFAALAVTGLAILLAAAFVEALQDSETLFTVAGAGLLAVAHAHRWRRRHSA